MQRQFRPAVGQVYRGGRWGVARLHVEHCWGILRAESWYRDLRAKGQSIAVGRRRTAVVKIEEGESVVTVECRENRLWKHGRLFFRCPQCDARVSRLYLPQPQSDPRCRRCWGLNYASQSLSYHVPALFWRLIRRIADET